MINNRNLDDFTITKNKCGGGEEEMVSVKDEALLHEQTKKTKNVADLPVFDVNMDLETFEGVTNEGKPFRYQYITGEDGERYRVPYVVLGQIKALLEEDSKLGLVKVKRSGEGKATTYLVIPKIK